MQNIGKKPRWQRFAAHNVIPKKSSVLRLMGVPADKRKATDSIDGPFAKAVEIFIEKANPRGGHCVCDPKLVASTLFAHSQQSKLYERLSFSTTCALFLVTVGDGPEKEAARLMNEGEYLLGTVLDTLASEAAECVVDKVQEEVVRELKLERAVRFSPGYGGWSLQAQPELLGAMNAEENGIELTEALMMLPKKSVSGVIVSQRTGDSSSPCDVCELKSCPKEGCWRKMYKQEKR